MICVAIGRGRFRHMMAEHRHLVEHGAQLVELRLDYIHGEVPVKDLVANRGSPVVITCRRESDGGKYSGSEEDRLLLLRNAIAEGVEYVDLEEDIATQVPRFGKTKRIISMHDFNRTPDNLDEIHARLCSLDPDIVKLSTMANHPQDNLRMFKLMQKSKFPTIAMCMGDMGTPSRLLAGRFGAPFTYATFHADRALAPGQLSYKEMVEIYHYDQINSQTAVYGVIADPVGHSYSPLIHNAAFKHEGINAVYVPFRVPREDVDQFIEQAPEMGIRGLSVTIPHKEAVLGKVTEFNDSIQQIGAANTLVFDGDRLAGFNTDYQAALTSLQQALCDEKGNENSFEGKTALVLGAGGVARAIAFGLLQRGAKVLIASLPKNQADELAEFLGCKSIEWVGRHFVPADLLVNCTPVGMHPNMDETPFDKHHLKPSMVVFDAVYNPENTLLIKNARSQSCKVVTGIEMFICQAAVQFKLFTGHQAPLQLMHDVLKRAIGAVKY